MLQVEMLFKEICHGWAHGFGLRPLHVQSNLHNLNGRGLAPRLEISVSMDILVLAFYGYIGYIGDISVDIFL